MGKAVSIQLLLVRSGSTDWLDAGRLQGRTDLPLSEPGQASFLGDLQKFQAGVGAGVGPAVVLHGPDEACRSSARLVASRWGGRLREVEGLRPVDMGLWEGLTGAQLKERHPTAYEQWLEDPTSVTPPEGEALAEAEERLLTALARALGRARGMVGLTMRSPAFGVVRCWLLGRPLSELWRVVEESPRFEVFSVPRTCVQDLAAQLKAGA